MTRRFTRAQYEQVFEHMFGELLPGATVQGINEVSLAQKYVLGSRMQLDDRAYRYARAGSTLNNKFGVKSSMYQHVLRAFMNTSALAGSLTAIIDVLATDGYSNNNPITHAWEAATGEITADELAGGYACFHVRPDADRRRLSNRRILHNTATPAGGGPMTLTIDVPLGYDMLADATMYVDCIASPYHDVRNDPLGAMTSQSVVGMATMSALVDEFLWLQTWGPCVCNCDLDVGDAGINSRQAVFGPDGNVHPPIDGTQWDQFAQAAGYIICSSNTDGPGRGAPFLFLQITP